MRKLKTKVGIIGCGNMGRGVAAGLIERGVITRSSLVVCEKDGRRRRGIVKHLRVRSASSIEELLDRSTVVVLAIKPQQLDGIVPILRDRLRRRHLVISLLAGVSSKRLRSKLGNVRVVRVMPNLGLVVGHGVTVIGGGSRKDQAVANTIFSACGRTVFMAEKYFDLVTAISGSGPAYFFYLMELLEGIGRLKGFPKQTARLLAKQTALGAAMLASCLGDDPKALRKRITSKGGTTEAAFSILGKKSFRSLFHRAMERAVKRAKELGGK